MIQPHKYLNCLFIVALLVSVGFSHAATGVSARFSEDGKKIIVEAPGINAFEFGSTIRFEADGAPRTLVGPRETVLEKSSPGTVSTPFGPAETFSVTYGDKAGEFAYTLTLKILKDRAAIGLEGEFHNRSKRDVKFNVAEVLSTSEGGRLELADPDGSLATPLMEDKVALPFAQADQGFREAVGVYNKEGAGFLVGPTGPPQAFTIVELRKGVLKAYSQMEGVLVKAGESRKSEPIVVCFETPERATELWTRWVAETHHARLKNKPVYGWCSWYDRTTKIDEPHVRDVLSVLAENPNVFGQGVLQIDDGYQKMDGDWSGNEKFPSGMAALAKDIRAKGWLPGIWFAPLMINPEHPWAKQHEDAIQKNAQGIASFMNANPFHPDGAHWIVPDHPESKKFLSNIIKDARNAGFEYIKIDFNGIGSIFHDPAKTSLQAFRELYALYREAAGEEMYMLSCLGQPTRGVIGFVDAARVGPDSHPAHFEKCLHSVLRFQIFDNVWWQNDPDVSYLDAALKSRMVGATPQGEGMWRTWHNVVNLVGGTSMVSEALDADDTKAVWRNFEIMRPSSVEPARLLTLGLSPENSVFGFKAKRAFGDFAVYNLYNSTGETKTLTLNFAAAGLPEDIECVVFDFWKNQVIGTAKSLYETSALEPLSSALLRFTPLTGDGPLLVGSNLHLSIGATEIGDIRTTADAVEIRLTDAGAQDGTLTFFSRRPLAAKGSEHCAIASVEPAGENLWKVNISGRLWGKPQSVSLAIK